MSEALTCAALIPAFEPDSRLTKLVSDLLGEGFRDIVIVDDGSGVAAQQILRDIEGQGIVILRHPKNRGKGAALRAGFEYILGHLPVIQGVVTVDADGQHAAREAAVVARECVRHPGSLTLGVRSFGRDAGSGVPLRSWLGNTFSRMAYGPVMRQPLRDTQSGLRGIPAGLLPWVPRLDGDRYEYETNMLISANRAGIPIHQVPIRTVYEEGNRSSHFHWLRDSSRIYFVVLRFYMSSLAAAAVDLLLFAGFWRLTAAYPLSFGVARAASSLVNFAINREFVFRAGNSIAVSLLRYYGLVILIGFTSFGVSRFMIAHGMPVFRTKAGVDTCLSVLSFSISRAFVFRRSTEAFVKKEFDG
ncbi:MAG TPA: glycosyltransferase [Bryobacteraceae bacterium]|nr:glycosyltransferase [Bryobacteraceae bacterium]